MPNSFLHDHNDFRELIDAVALEQCINDPALVEKITGSCMRFEA